MKGCTTSNQSHFKAYEASDARNARSHPSQVRPCQEQHRLDLGPLQIWERHREDYPVLGMPSEASASGRKYIPAAELVHMRPIPERPFGGVSHYTQHQAAAQQARHDYFPYRDEFHPRSKRLLYEMALNSVDDRTCAASEDTFSCFTLPSTTKSQKSSTEKSIASAPRSLSSSRLPTGDSLRVGNGKPGALAHRRAQAFFRSPSQSHVDREWYVNMNEKEGPAAIYTTNYRPRFYNGTLDTYGQALAEMSALLDGERETQPRERTNK
eukprot:symbB.v1.2.032233.t1/scaffold3840.1/size49441/1